MVFKLRLREAGGHTDATVFVAPHPDQTYANIGTLTARPEEIEALAALLGGFESVKVEAANA